MGKFVINATATGFTFWLKAKNGETILTSEVYSTEAACRKGIQSVINNAPDAALEDQTTDAVQKHPKFEVYLDKRDEYRFRLTAKNGEPIGASEGYARKASCLDGVESVRKNVVDAEIEKKE